MSYRQHNAIRVWYPTRAIARGDAQATLSPGTLYATGRIAPGRWVWCTEADQHLACRLLPGTRREHVVRAPEHARVPDYWGGRMDQSWAIDRPMRRGR